MMGQSVVKNVTGSDVKWLDVPAMRFVRWIAGFAVRHGAPAADAPGDSLAAVVAPGRVTFTAPDGAAAQCHPPFAESFTVPGGDGGERPGPAALAAAIAAHASAPRVTGVLLIRLGGYAAGVFTGYPPTLADAKTGSRPVHGRSAAGGWSQQRFARRREKQAGEAVRAAADAAVLVFGRWSGAPLQAVVLGGDKRAAAELDGDPRLAPYLARATGRFITVPDPRRSVLEASPAQFAAVRIMLSEPAA